MILIPAHSRGWIKISGAEAKEWLQGLVTNDLRILSATHSLYTLLLTPQGRFWADFFVYAHGDDLLLDVERALIPDLVRKLKLHRLRLPITIEDVTGTYHLWYTLGIDPLTQEWMPDPRLSQLGGRCLTTRAEAPLEAEIGTESLYQQHRLRLGVAEGRSELPFEKAIPLEWGMDELHAIGWEKGCYLGQELTARTRYRGLIRKRVFPIQGEGAPLVLESTLSVNGQEVGEVKVVAGNVGLAMIRLEYLPHIMAQNNVLSTADGKNVVMTCPDWLKLPTL